MLVFRCWLALLQAYIGEPVETGINFFPIISCLSFVMMFIIWNNRIPICAQKKELIIYLSSGAHVVLLCAYNIKRMKKASKLLISSI